jgi:hypothetical protein
MRFATMAFVGAFGLAASAVSASAAPPVPSLGAQHDTNIVQVAGGCGPAFHPNRWGRCVPNRGYDRYGYDRPRPYWGGAYRGWGSPDDHVARELNRGELGRGYSGSSVPYR